MRPPTSFSNGQSGLAALNLNFAGAPEYMGSGVQRIGE
jgi:hypothetical protein